MFAVRPPFLIKYFTKHFINWEIKTNKKVIYLTFDDGPIPEVTPKVIEILAKFNAKATFFCVGDNAYKHPEVLQLLKDNHHQIGNHTYNHLNAWENDKKHYIENVFKAQEILNSPFFRPPYGKFNLKLLKILRNNYKIITWSVLTGDFNKKLSSEQCLHNAIAYTKQGSIVVFHDSIKASAHLFYVLPIFLKHFTDKGFTFEVLEKEICI